MPVEVRLACFGVRQTRNRPPAFVQFPHGVGRTYARKGSPESSAGEQEQTRHKFGVEVESPRRRRDFLALSRPIPRCREDIPGSFGVSLRDDFGVSAERLQIVKAALTAEQVRTMGLHEGQLSKETSSRYRRFVAAHGERAWELESLTADQLREIAEVAIRGMIDLKAFEAEVEREEQEQRDLESKRRQLRRALIDDVNEFD
jgi:hypothetical protein